MLKGEDLKSFKGQVQDELSIKFVSQLTLFSKRTILNIGMLLTEGDVAKEIRSRLLDIEYESNNATQENGKTVKEIVRTWANEVGIDIRKELKIGA